MKLPIPNDWNKTDWTCIEVQWPDSPQWIGILSGLLTSIMRGRLWDENTGIIHDAQAIGEQIYAANFPFNYCASDSGSGSGDGNDSGSGSGDSGYASAVCDAIEGGLAAMTLCGYNPNAFKIVDGVLYVKDFCGDWVAIGNVGSINNQVTDPTIIPDPPIASLEDSTPCAKANKLAVMTHTIVTQAFAEIDAEEDPYDFYTDMRDFIPGVDLAFNDLMNMWFQLIPLEIAGQQAETTTTDAIAWIACNFEPLIPDDGNQGISEDTYNDLRGAIQDAMVDAFPPDGWGWYKAQREVWTRAFWSIGAKDAEKMTYYAQPVPGQSCDCPDVLPEYSGIVWYDATYTNPIATGGCSLFSATRTASNEARMNMVGGYNANYQECHVIWDLGASGTIREIEIQAYIEDNPSPLPDYFPSDTYDGANPTPASQYFKPTISAGGGTVTYSQPGKNLQNLKVVWATDVNLDTATITFPVKFNPKAQNVSGGPQTFRIRAKIIYAGPVR